MACTAPAHLSVASRWPVPFFSTPATDHQYRPARLGCLFSAQVPPVNPIDVIWCDSTVWLYFSNAYCGRCIRCVAVYSLHGIADCEGNFCAVRFVMTEQQCNYMCEDRVQLIIACEVWIYSTLNLLTYLWINNKCNNSLYIIQQSNTTSNIYLIINEWATSFGH